MSVLNFDLWVVGSDLINEKAMDFVWDTQQVLALPLMWMAVAEVSVRYIYCANYKYLSGGEF